MLCHPVKVLSLSSTLLFDCSSAHCAGTNAEKAKSGSGSAAAASSTKGRSGNETIYQTATSGSSTADATTNSKEPSF